MPNRNIARWMTRHVVTVAPGADLDTADALMHRHDVSRLLVMEGPRLVGILSRGDLRAAKVAAAADVRDYHHVPTVADAMTPGPITIPVNATIALAAQTMLKLKVGGLPVVDPHGRVCGIVSQSDLCRFIVDLAHDTRRDAA
ncbi:MAG: CBS domain-containing protein [Gammaproteobacteria bacterium]